MQCEVVFIRNAKGRDILLRVGRVIVRRSMHSVQFEVLVWMRAGINKTNCYSVVNRRNRNASNPSPVVMSEVRSRSEELLMAAGL